jgi:hypothetical protein
MQSCDQLRSGPLAQVVGVVAVTEEELSAGGGMVSDSPATRRMAVVLLDQLIDAGAYRADDAEFSEVRAEAGPNA